MQAVTHIIKNKPSIRNLRNAVIILFITGFFGIAELGAPFELAIESIRNKFRAQSVSQEIAIVGIDDASLARVGTWPWNGEILSELTDNIFEQGAERVFFSMVLLEQSKASDQALADTFSNYPGKVFLAAKKDRAQPGAPEADILPSSKLRDAAQLASVNRYVKFWNGVDEVDARETYQDQEIDAMEMALADKNAGDTQSIPVDYSYQLSSFPYVSALKILDSETSPHRFDGQDVIIGLNGSTLSTRYATKGQRTAPIVFIIGLGAETLKRGEPTILGWVPIWLLSCGVALYILSGLPNGRQLTVGTISLTLLMAAPFLLLPGNIWIEVAPSLFLIGWCTTSTAWQRFGARQKKSGSTNPVSGLRTINAIRHDDRCDNRTLISARIRRYTDIVSTLPAESERKLVHEILSRLQLCAFGSEILQGDDGNFFWLSDVSDPTQMADSFQAMSVIFRSPIRIDASSFDVDVSFGVDQEGDITLSHRISHAMAAARAAESESNYWKLHNPRELDQKSWSLSLLGEMDAALENGRIWVAYQPKVDLKTRNVIGAEALVRWTHETRGPINPAEFIEVAEQHNRIDKLTVFVLNDALAFANEARKIVPDFRIAINISPGLLASDAFLVALKIALHRHDFEAPQLILEVTETMAMIQSEAPAKIMAQLRELGVGLSIDDYGTGMSTLEYLKKIPATELKIDRSFTADICANSNDQKVMKSTIALAHELGMKTVAEGIETLESVEMISSMGCDLGQGYSFARPMKGEDFISMTLNEYSQLFNIG